MLGEEFMKEVLEESRENLERIKKYLNQEAETYSNQDLVVIQNKQTERYEILIPKRETKQHQKKENRVYRNLKGENAKIIIQKGFVYVIPKKYSFNFKMLANVLNEEEKNYTVNELREMEERINDSKLKSSRQR